MGRSAQPTFIYRGHGIEFCVYANYLMVTTHGGLAPTSQTYELHLLRDIAIDPPAHLVITLADGSSFRYPLGMAVERARNAIVREL